MRRLYMRHGRPLNFLRALHFLGMELLLGRMKGLGLFRPLHLLWVELLTFLRTIDLRLLWPLALFFRMERLGLFRPVFSSIFRAVFSLRMEFLTLYADHVLS